MLLFVLSLFAFLLFVFLCVTNNKKGDKTKKESACLVKEKNKRQSDFKTKYFKSSTGNNNSGIDSKTKAAAK